MEYLYYFVLYLFEIIKFYLIDKYYLLFEEKKVDIKKRIVSITGVIVVAVFFADYSNIVNPLLVYIPFVVIESVLFFRSSFLKLVIFSIISMEAISIMDYMGIVLETAILNVFGIQYNELKELLGSVFTIIFIVAIKEILKRENKGYVNKIPILYMVGFMLLEMGNAILLGWLQTLIDVQQNIVLKIVFLFVILGMFLEMALVLMLSALKEVYKERDQLNQKYLLWQEEHYRYLERREEETKKFRHDMRNHIYILQTLCEKQEMQSVKQYIKKIGGKLETAGSCISVNNGIVDAVFNKYAEQCKEEKILLKVEGHMPVQVVIDAFDLCAIFSNLLSNAIDAVTNYEKKQIILDIRYDEDFIFIKMQNYFNGALAIQDGRIVIHKPDKKNHGYGLNNIRESVEKYHGFLDFQIDKDEFITMVSIKNEHSS